MGTTGKRIEGKAEELKGKLKKLVGDAIDNEQMQLEGRVEELKGKSKQEGAKTVERVKGKVEELVGRVQQLKGVARQEANRKS